MAKKYKKRYVVRNIFSPCRTNNYVQDIIDVLERDPFLTEKELIEKSFGEVPTKRHYDMVRRGLTNGVLARVEVNNVAGTKARYFYYVPK